MSKKWEALAKKLEKAQQEQEAAQEVVVGALRGLLETAVYDDRASIAILKGFQKVVDPRMSDGDDAMDDALSLFFEKLNAKLALDKESRETITRGDLV